jgi:hypothetical protein
MKPRDPHCAPCLTPRLRARFLWGKHEGDAKQLTPLQSMLSGFSAAFLGPIATGACAQARVVRTAAWLHAAPPHTPVQRQRVCASHAMLSVRACARMCAARLVRCPAGPMDVIKTRLMAQGKEQPAGAAGAAAAAAAAAAAGGGGGAAAAAAQQRYSGLFDALVKIPRQEGITALWRGLLPRLMRIPPGQAIVWAVSDQITG